MKILYKACLAGLLALVAGGAWADRGWHHPRTSVHLGVQFGPPVFYPPVYPYWPHVYVPPTVIVSQPAPPPVYIERSPPVTPAVPALEPGFWYYCQEAGAYYPQVRQCAGDWHKVAPQAPR